MCINTLFYPYVTQVLLTCTVYGYACLIFQINTLHFVDKRIAHLDKIFIEITSAGYKILE